MITIDSVPLAMAGVMFSAALVEALVSDARAFRIPDRDSLVIAGAFACTLPVLGLEAGIWHLGAGLAVFAFGAALFAFGLWGGGDVKLSAAVALMTGFAGLPRFLMVMALAGGVLALGVLLARRLRPAMANRIPYGLAIAAGGFDWALASLLPRLAG